MTTLLCSNCFSDEGLKLDAIQIGILSGENCPNCKSKDGRKLDKETLEQLADRFFVRGTTTKFYYGAAPLLQFNELQYNNNCNVQLPSWLHQDKTLIENALKIGFFHYGPRYWMMGEVEPLKDLQITKKRSSVINRILSECPSQILSQEISFYRLRKNPKAPENILEYDSPPNKYLGQHRLDSPKLPVLYASQDLEVCIHECRVTVEDNLYVATLVPNKDLRLLDLTEVLEEECTEFESLGMAVHMLFRASKHSYKISRKIALAAQVKGFDGLIYPSYFSDIRIGTMPFQTANGLPVRRFPSQREYKKFNNVQNIALFGRPISKNIITVKSINKLFINTIVHGFSFGPAKIN
jgi:hypothetical protein